MTVAELVEELQKQPSWAEVTLHTQHDYVVESVQVANLRGTVVRIEAGPTHPHG